MLPVASAVTPTHATRPVITVSTNPRAGTLGASIASQTLTMAMGVAEGQVGQQLTADVAAQAEGAPLSGAAAVGLASPIDIKSVVYHPLPNGTGNGLSAFYWGIGKVLDMANPSVVRQIQTTRQKLLDEGFGLGEVSQRIEELRMTGEIPMYNYTIPILMLVGLGVVSIFLAFQLKRADRRQEYGLELPSNH